ncbi:hypothetical protein PV08_03666 [Exophiala spinifera]|uniref:Uncharacterized protein n=1 Tax=Exophiala spinifera TaxID=91928 RepID=A0A0D1YVR2_9EURO|nr:uncharacterized protein PV08_03666 [Exophiala spinifera]KIW19371.1 hypothetical protein PV08_03666 [Exophiala spinifera]
MAVSTAISHHGLTSELVPSVTAAIELLGLSGIALQLLLEDLVCGQPTATAKLLGVIPNILKAAGLATKKAYISGFRNGVYLCSVFCISGSCLASDPKNNAEYSKRLK